MDGWSLDFADTFPRRLRSGASEVYVGALDVVLISKAFTAGEDVVVSWLLRQDETSLVDVYGLPDGRDLFILQREHRTQTLLDAVKEHQLHLRRKVRNDLQAGQARF